MKEVVKAVRKGEKGFVLIAGDISPIDVIAHLPILCEDMVCAAYQILLEERHGALGGLGF